MTYDEDDLRSALKLLEQRTPTVSADSHAAAPVPPAGRRRVVRYGAPLLAAALVVAGSVAIAAHLGDQDRSSTNRTQTSTPTPDPSAPYWFPLDGYRQSTSQFDILFDAQYKLANTCIHEHGLTGTLPTDLHQGTLFYAIYAANIRPLTVADAQKFGYDIPTTPSTGADSSYPRLASNPTTVACVATADRQLMGDAAAANPGGGLLGSDEDFVLNDLTARSISQAESDPRMATKNRAWAACMAQHGYPGYDAPADAIGREAHGATVSTTERQRAVQDAKCKDAVAYLTTWAALIREYQSRLVNQNHSRLNAIEARLISTVRRAQAVLDR